MATIITDEAGVIVLWEEHAERLLGFDASAALGRALSELVSMSDVGEGVQVWEGASGPMRLSVTRTAAKMGADSAWCYTFHPADATNLEAMSELFESAGVLVQSVDREGRFIYVNPAWSELLGYTREELEGGSFMDILAPEDHEHCAALFRSLVEGGGPQQIAVSFVTREGLNLRVRGSVSALRDDEGRFVMSRGVFTDVTQSRLNDALVESILGAHADFIESGAEPRVLFDRLLTRMLGLTQSEYGFIGEIGEDEEGRYLKSYAITNIAWDEETRSFYDTYAPSGLVFRNLETLFGAVMVTGEPVLSNTPEEDPRSGGLPPGHPEMRCFMGLPIYRGDVLTGMVGMANRPGGYQGELVEFLEPLLATCASLITARKMERERRRFVEALESREAQMRAIFEAAPDGILTLGASGRIRTCNPACSRIFGAPEASLVDRPARSLFDSINREVLRRGGDALGLRASGETFPAEISVSQMQGPSEGMRTVVIRDVSERREVEQLKNEFVSVVSHELRTPLTAIQGAMRLLEAGVAGELPPKARELVQIGVSNGFRLSRLIDDILDFRKIASGNLELELAPVPMRALLQRSCHALHLLARDADVELRLEPGDDAMVVADAPRLEQVMANLLSNAIKFTEPSSEVRVRLEPRGDQVRIAVIDAGPGLSASDQEGLFRPFQQLKQRDRSGTGLGLAISKAIIDLHGGRIGVESAPGEGSCFYFELDVMRSE